MVSISAFEKCPNHLFTQRGPMLQIPVPRMMMYPCLGSCVNKAQVQLVQVETSTLSASMLPLGQVRGVALRLQSENSTHSNNSYKRDRRMEKRKCIKLEDAFCYHVMQEAQKTVDFIVQSLEIQWRNGSHWLICFSFGFQILSFLTNSGILELNWLDWQPLVWA